MRDEVFEPTVIIYHADARASLPTPERREPVTSLRSANVSMSMRNASLSLAVSRFPALVVPMRHART